MWTYGAISLTVTLAVIAAGVLGFLTGWTFRGAIMRERDRLGADEAHREIDPRGR